MKTNTVKGFQDFVGEDALKRMKMKKIKVLCICAKGLNRSKYLSEYLAKKGYDTKYRGLEPLEFNGRDITNYLFEEDIRWAEIVIIVRKRLAEILKSKFDVEGKRLIIFDITDSKKLISEKYPEARDWTKKKMNEKITYPTLRKAIKPYLPLKV